MVIEFESCKVEDKVVTAVAKFTVALSDIDRVTNKATYEHESMPRRIAAIVAEKLAAEYLQHHKMEIINAVDIKQLKDALQLKVIEGFSLQRNQ